MSPLEKMARAINPEAWEETENLIWANGQKFKALNRARAALLAIREPDDQTFWDAQSVSTVYVSPEHWTAMIDTILNQEPRS